MVSANKLQLTLGRVYGACLSQSELSTVIDLFGNEEGVVKYKDLLCAVVGGMSPYRKKLLRNVFKSVSDDGGRNASVDSLLSIFNARAHPLVTARKKDATDVTAEMRKSLGRDTVSFEDFCGVIGEFSSFEPSDSGFQ